MKKFINLILFVGSIFLLINWSKQNTSSKYCNGTVFFNKSDELKKEELVDVKIGTSTEFSDNQKISVFKKPENNIKAEDYTEYILNLDKISSITVNQSEPIFKSNDEKYINIIITFLNQTSDNYIIQKNKKIIGKVKKTGITGIHSFLSIYKLVIECCMEKDDKN